MSNDLFLAIATDCSGSMRPLAGEMVNGFNALVKEQAAEAGETWVTHIAFDTRIDIVHRAWGAAHLPAMTIEDYGKYQGMTALRDAMGTLIRDTERWLADNTWFTGRVMVAVLTDGYENSSQEFSAEQLRSMKTDAEARGWAFTFIGQGFDAWDQASQLGMLRGQTVSTAGGASGQSVSYSGLSNTVSSYRTTGDASWKGDRAVSRTADEPDSGQTSK